jgi:hypothetical protein
MKAARNSLAWIIEPLENDPTYLRKRMFGFEAAYVNGLLYFVVADREEPWNGLLVCTSHDRQAALVSEFPDLAAHAVLGKWLYISQDDPAFEPTAEALVNLAREYDPRLGVEPRPRKKSTRAMKPPAGD